MSYTAFFLKYSGFFSAFCVFLQLPLYPLTSRHKGSIRIKRYQCPKQKHVQQIFSKIRNFRWICDAALYRSTPAHHTPNSYTKRELVGARPLHLAYARPFGRLKAPLGLSLLRFAAQTRTTLFLLCTKSYIVWRKIGVWCSFRWKSVKRKSLKLLGTSRSFRLCFA